jgi:hypothetical protein
MGHGAVGVPTVARREALVVQFSRRIRGARAGFVNGSLHVNRRYARVSKYHVARVHGHVAYNVAVDVNVRLLKSYRTLPIDKFIRQFKKNRRPPTVSSSLHSICRRRGQRLSNSDLALPSASNGSRLDLESKNVKTICSTLDSIPFLFVPPHPYSPFEVVATPQPNRTALS